jgi:hypothetical protein
MSDGYDVLLRDGGIARLRPLVPGDRQALHALADQCTERSAYLRFFTGGRSTAHGYMDRVTGERYRGHAVVALVRDELVAIAEYIPMDGGRADLAILSTTRHRAMAWARSCWSTSLWMRPTRVCGSWWPRY